MAIYRLIVQQITSKALQQLHSKRKQSVVTFVDHTNSCIFNTIKNYISGSRMPRVL
jgi:hypothetical protein